MIWEMSFSLVIVIAETDVGLLLEVLDAEGGYGIWKGFLA